MKLSLTIGWRIVAPLLVILAGISWGLIGLFSTYLSSVGLSPVQITVVRCSVAAVVIGVFLASVKPHAFRIRLRHLWMFVGTGVISIAFYILLALRFAVFRLRLSCCTPLLVL